jgi:hypothetical protein
MGLAVWAFYFAIIIVLRISFGCGRAQVSPEQKRKTSHICVTQTNAIPNRNYEGLFPAS